MKIPKYPKVPNQLTEEEHDQLHSNPPAIAYDDLERLIRDWIMQHEGYDEVFKPIMLGNGVTQSELNAVKGGTDIDTAPDKERMDELYTIYKASEDRAYLIVIIKLYQLAVNFAPIGHYKHHPIVGK